MDDIYSRALRALEHRGINLFYKTACNGNGKEKEICLLDVSLVIKDPYFPGTFYVKLISGVEIGLPLKEYDDFVEQWKVARSFK